METRKDINKEKKKRSGWIRTVDILMRAGHIGTTGVLFGGAIFAVPFANLSTWHKGTLATGCVLALLEACQSRHWVYQIRGLMVLTHIGLLGAVHLYPDYRALLLATVLAIGVIGSHMPSGIRHWSLVHRCRID
jgi:hypothetical protein